MAGFAPYSSRFVSAGVITYEELFDLADQWMPESEAADSLRAIRDQMPDDSSSDAAWQQWEVSVIEGVYEWSLFYLDVALESVETSTDLQAEDRESLSVYVSDLIGFVEDQWALSVPLFSENPRLDVTTLGILTGTAEAEDLYQAWRDVTEDSPYDTETGIRDASMNVCGEEVLDIGA